MIGKLPDAVGYVIVGAGVHGLSTAWHLAMELTARGTGSGADIIVLDKSAPGAGATGIACGCVRGFYMTEPLHALIRHSVDVWSSDPITLGFQQVGYVSCGEANQIADYERIHASQNSVGYTSDLYLGRDARRHLSEIWPDFKHHSIEVALHERLSGYAGTAQAVQGLRQMCERHGVQIFSGIEVVAYDVTDGRLGAVVTDHGTVRCDAAVLGLGAWTPRHWRMLELPMHLDVGYRDGSRVDGKDMWTFWRLEEGEIAFDAPYVAADGRNPPVLHIELMNTPVTDPETGATLGDSVYVYWKNGSERLGRPGIQGGAMPEMLGPDAAVEPYGHANDDYQPGPKFAAYITACMEMFLERFKGVRAGYRQRNSGGIGAFTPDNVPILDWVLDNVYLIADSNHGFKMTGIGKLVARHLASGDAVAELAPFAMARFAEGNAFGSGTTNSPWV